MRDQVVLSGGHVDDGDVELAGGDPLDQGFRIALADQQLDFRITRGDLRGRCGEGALRRRGDHADADAAGDAPVKARHFFLRVIDVLDDRSGEGGQRFPGGRQRDAMGGAEEQLLADGFFQFRNLHAQCGLHDIELPRGAGDVALAGKAQEVFELLEVHSGLYRG